MPRPTSSRPTAVPRARRAACVRAVPVTLLLLAGLLSACSGPSLDSAGESPASAAQPDGGSAASGADGTGRSENAAADSDTAGATADKSEPGAADDVAASGADPGAGVTRLVRTAEVTVQVANVTRAAGQVRTAAVSLGGIVGSETTNFASEGGDGDEPATDGSAGRSVLALRVPEPVLDDLLTRIAGVGTELDRSTSTEDVTATIADLDSRVATQTRSVARVRELLDRADSLQDVVLLESELARREADLESVQARQRALADRAALSTVTVTLVTRVEDLTGDEEEVGFLAGLESGWEALLGTTMIVLTILGALLPIAFVLALIGLPAYQLRRRRRAAAPASATGTSAGASAAGAGDPAQAPSAAGSTTGTTPTTGAGTTGATSPD